MQNLKDIGTYDLTKELRNRNNAVAIWSPEDIMHQAELDDIPITSKEAEKICKQIDEYHDATVGINWDVISTHIWMWRSDNPFPYQELLDEGIPIDVQINNKTVESEQEYRGKVGTIKEKIDEGFYKIEFPNSKLPSLVFDDDQFELYQYEWRY